MNAKERILAVLNHQKPDRMPCFGANSTVTYDQMDNVQAFWPEGHENGEIMAILRNRCSFLDTLYMYLLHTKQHKIH